ncbi:MAG: glycine--tRNA ligase subunit beta, partial [Anaerolineales bacterium]
AFSRPIRWLLALHGGQAIPFKFAGLTAGRNSRGLRFDEQPTFTAADPAAYRQEMKRRGIILDAEERQAEIRRQVEILAEEVGAEIVEDPALFQEVTHLVETPTALRGRFDESFLQLPRPVLISVMRKHQRYFALEKQGELVHYFVTVRNGGDENLDSVRAGNEDVLRARFEDAAFFVERDLAQPFESYLAQLKTLTFESSLGSMRDKVERVEALIPKVAEWLSLDQEQRVAAQRAAHLSKADLATQMVVEMTSLQGEMGRIYAEMAGENEAVAVAIAEHYLPRYSGDRVPESKVGLALGIADRLDSLIGLFSAGMEPSGGGDPFALRRTAIGLVEALVAHQQPLDLRRALAAAADGLPIESGPETLEACLAFIRRRQQSLLLAEGHRHDVVRAVLSEQGHDPARAKRAVGELEAWMDRESWPAILQNYARCVRITRDLDEKYEVDPSAFEEAESRALWELLQQAESGKGEDGSVDRFMSAFLPLVPAIEAFFDEVLVMAEREAVKRNRLGLLQRVAMLAQGVSDLSEVEGF